MGRRGRMISRGLGVLVGNGWGRGRGGIGGRRQSRWLGTASGFAVGTSLSRRNQSLRNRSGSLAMFAAGVFFFSRRSAAFAVPFRNCRFAVGGQFVVVLSHASLSLRCVTNDSRAKLQCLIVACGTNVLGRCRRFSPRRYQNH